MSTPDPKKKPRRGFGANPTAAYRGGSTAWWGYGSAALDGAPVFTFFDVPRMLRDPQVRFLERMWRAPFQKVKWAVKAESPAVAKFVGTTLRRFWRRSLPKLLSRYWRYGYAPGGAEFCAHKGKWRLERVRAVEPRDAQPRVWASGPRAGQPAGFTLGSGTATAAPAAGGDAWVAPPHAFWFAGFGDLTPWHDVPPISGLFDPWLEKRGRNGAVHSRKLWFRKAAWRGAILYHPPGETNVGTDEDPQLRENQDMAREALDYHETGSTLTLENELMPDGSGKRAWEFVEAQALSDVAGVREYPGDLDREMSTGAGIPPEVLEASEVGSGWSGRLIPLLGYLGTVDELSGMVIESADQWLRPLVAVNFGRRSWYEVEPRSLADEVQQQQGKGGGGPDGGGPQNPAQLFDGKPPPEPPADQNPESKPLTLSATLPPERPAHRYGCVLAPLPGAVAHVANLQRQIGPADLADKGMETEPHVTVRYGLHGDDAELGAALAALAAREPFELRFEAPAHFAGPEYDVIMLPVMSGFDGPLREMHERLGDLNHTDTHPSYRPHLTVAYVKPGKGAEYLSRLGYPRTTLRETVTDLVYSDRDGARTALPLRVPAPAAMNLSWTEYTGPKGGKGWVSDTGEVRYQAEKPGDAEGGEQGPESVFGHAAFAHIPEHTSDVEPRDFAKIRADAHAAAEAAGIDPAELHREAARALHYDVNSVAQAPERFTPEQHLQNHAAQEGVHRALAERSANQARAARAEEAEARAEEAEYRRAHEQNPNGPIHYGNWAALQGKRAGDLDREAAGHEQAARESLAKADGHKAAADRIRAGEVPKVHSINRRNLLAGAYKDAHKRLAAEKEARDDAARFADSYFDEDRPARRAANYLEHFDGGADADLLPEDTRAAAAEDLAHAPVAKLADHAFRVAGYDPASAEHRIMTAAVDAAAVSKPPKPLPFDGKSPDKYILVHPENTGEDEFAGMQQAARLLPGVKAPLAGAILVKASSPLGKLAEEHGAGESLDGSEQHLFTALKTGYQLPQEHVPASAKDYGGTSGSKGSGEFHPEEDWSPHAVPVYKRVNEDWYVRMNPGTGTGADGDDEPAEAGYELVHKSAAPPLARLPDVYWHDLDADTPGADEEAVERAQKRKQKRSETGAAQKKDIGEWRAAVKQLQGSAGKLRREWNQALKGVPEDERPEEPDWDGPDASALTDQHDSREDHESALSGLAGEYEEHLDALREHIEGAKEHAANHRANAAASDKARDEWEDALADVPEEERPEEPDWREDLGGDQEAHAKFLAGQLAEARQAAEAYGAVHHETAERHRAEWQKSDAKIREKLGESKYAKKVADADDAINDTINGHLYGTGADDFLNRFSNDRDDYPEDEAGDEAHAAVEAVQGAMDDLQNAETPDHEDGPDHDDYALDEGEELPSREEWDGTPAERAERFEQAADEHKGRAAELYEEVSRHYTNTLIRSDEWRKSMREHLERVRDTAAAAAKALPEGDYPAATHRAELEELAKRASDLLSKAQPHKEGPSELSATPGEGGPAPGGRLARMREAKLRRLVALAMTRLQLQARAAGNPRGAARALARLAELARDPGQVAALVGLAPLELSWQPYIGKRGERAGTQVGWYNPDSKEVRYQTAKPGEGAARLRGRQASGSAGLAIAHKVHDGTATADDLGELVDHLRAMTVPRLKNVAVMLDKSLSGLKNRDKMVNALLGHVGGLTAADGTKSDGSTAAPEAPPAPAEPQPGEVRTVPTGQLKIDPKRFQFKLNTSNPAGVTKELQEVKTFNPEFAGVVAVWRDPADGTDYVVNGHHRHELAERTGHPHLAVRYLQAKDAREARAKGALINIAEGRGTAVDAAKFMRDMGVSPGDLAKHGVSLKGKLAADAAALTKLNDRAFDRVARGTLDPEKALAVARHLDNPERQEKLFKFLDKREESGKDLSGRTIEELARQMAAAPSVTTKEESLFGDLESEDDAFVERADLAAHVRAALAQEHNDFGAVASNRRAGKVAGAGNSLNVEENKKRAAEAEALKNVYDLSAHRKGAVADALDAGAVRLKQAKTKRERDRARTETLDAVRDALRGRLADPAGTGAADGGGKGGVDSGRAQGGGTQPAAKPAEGTSDAGRGGEPPAGVAPAGTQQQIAAEITARRRARAGVKVGADDANPTADEIDAASRPAKPAPYSPPADPVAVAREAMETYKNLPPRAPGDGGPPIPRPAEVAALLGRAEALSRPLAQGLSSFLNGGQRYSYRMFHVARELLERHERDAAKARAPAAPGMTAPSMPAAGTPETNAAADHAPAITAIPRGDSRFVAGHRVRHTADGKFQVERKGGYLTGDAAAVAAHIRTSWENQTGYPSTPAALARAAAYPDPDPFTDPAAAERDAKLAARVPEGTKAVSLDPDTHGRLGTVRKDAAGRPYLEFDGGEELRGSAFEPLDAAHSWRAAPDERAARAPKGGATGSLFDTGGAPEPKAPAPKPAPAPPPKPAPTDPGAALFDTEPDHLFNQTTESKPAPDPQAELGKVPHAVRQSIEWALGGLREHADSLARARDLDRQFRGGGRYEREANDKGRGAVAQRLARLDQFRGLAATNGVDADAVIAALGGMPRHEPSAAGANYRFADEAERAPAPEPPEPTDRGSLDSIKRATDRALGVAQSGPPEPPKRGRYGAFLKGVAADPAKFAELEKLAPLPTLDRGELLAAVAEVYGPEVHAAAKKKSKQGIVELLKGAPPRA